MTNQDQEAFVALMALLDEAYAKETSAGRIEIYWQGLRDLDLEAVKKAITRAAMTLDYYPKLSELRRLILGAPDDLAVQAWAEVMRAIEDVGTHRTVRFEDPLIHFALEAMGGWTKCADWFEDELPFRQRDFAQLYQIALKRGITWAQVPDHLAGFTEITNGATGFPDKTPPAIEMRCSYLTLERRKELGQGRKELNGPEQNPT